MNSYGSKLIREDRNLGLCLHHLLVIVLSVSLISDVWYKELKIEFYLFQLKQVEFEKYFFRHIFIIGYVFQLYDYISHIRCGWMLSSNWSVIFHYGNGNVAIESRITRMGYEYWKLVHNIKKFFGYYVSILVTQS